MITFGGCPGGPADLTVTYNQGGCGPKFVSADGLRELKPFSGTVQVSVTCPE